MSMHLLTLSFVALMFMSAPGRADVQDACTFMPKADLQKLVGHELRDGKAKDVCRASRSARSRRRLKRTWTRRFENPALPAAANFNSITVTTFPTTVATFAESRKTMAADATDIPGVGDSTF